MSVTGFSYHRLKNASLNDLVSAAQALDQDNTPPMNEIISRFDGYARYVARASSACPYQQDELANAARLALVQAVRNHDLRPRGFPAFATRYMRGAALREVQRVRRPEHEVSLEAVGEPSEEAGAAEEDAVLAGPWGDGQIASAVATLTPGQREIARLRYVEDASLAHIAAIMGTSSSAVSQRLTTIHRAVATAVAA